METLALDIFYYFKYSAVKKEQFQEIQQLFNVANHTFLKHVHTRWLSMGASNDRLLEQLIPLKEFFLKNVSNQQLKGDKTRYDRICNSLRDTTLLPTMLFVKSVTTMFHHFETSFQSECPMVHVLYSELVSLVRNLLKRFMKSDVVNDCSDRGLKSLDIEDSTQYLMVPEVGLDTMQQLSADKKSGNLSELKSQLFLKSARDFYKKAAKKLIDSLPLGNQILRDLRVLNPESRDKSNSVTQVKRLINVFESHIPEEERDLIVDE